MRLLKLCKPRTKIIQSYGEDLKIAYIRSAKGVLIDDLVELDLEAMIEVQRFLVKSIRYVQDVKRCEELREARKSPLIYNQDLTALNIKLDQYEPLYGDRRIVKSSCVAKLANLGYTTDGRIGAFLNEILESSQKLLEYWEGMYKHEIIKSNQVPNQV